LNLRCNIATTVPLFSLLSSSSALKYCLCARQTLVSDNIHGAGGGGAARPRPPKSDGPCDGHLMACCALAHAAAVICIAPLAPSCRTRRPLPGFALCAVADACAAFRTPRGVALLRSLRRCCCMLFGRGCLEYLRINTTRS